MIWYSNGSLSRSLPGSWKLADAPDATDTFRFAATGQLFASTVTVKVHELVLSAGSLAVQVTVVTPIGKVLPGGGVQSKAAMPHGSNAEAM